LQHAGWVFPVLAHGAALACFHARRKAAKQGMEGRLLVIPDTVKFLFVVGLIAGAAFGAVWGLATFPPEQGEVVKPLPHEKLRQT
jgi:hypothetical protein